MLRFNTCKEREKVEKNEWSWKAKERNHPQKDISNNFLIGRKEIVNLDHANGQISDSQYCKRRTHQEKLGSKKSLLNK